MKKSLIAALMIIAVSFVSCTKEDVGSQAATVTFSIQAANPISTRAAAPAVPGWDARYIVELWNADKSARIGRYVQLNNPDFSIIMDKSISYYVAVWVDYITDVDDSTPTPADYYYVTSNFARIALNVEGGDPDAFDHRVYKMSNLPARDAFTGVFSFLSGQAYPATLQVKRPLAKINVIAADASIWKNRTEIGGDSITIRLTNPGYYTYNVLEQKSVATAGNVEYINTIYAATYNAYPSGQAQTVLSGLYFAQTDPDSNLPNTQIFNIHWKVGEATESVINLTALPFRRNYNTNIRGGLIFNVATFSIDSNTVYDTPDITTGW